MNKHLMLDFETLGNTPDAAVLSLGAVVFTAEQILEEAEWHFQVHDQLKAKSAVNFDTLAWWAEQSSKAREVFSKCKTHGLSVAAFVDHFFKFTGGHNDLRVWGNGATFDVSIIENILARAGRPAPWKFWNVRCYRTLKACHDIEKGVQRQGAKHCALDDAKYQAQCVQGFFALRPEADR